MRLSHPAGFLTHNYPCGVPSGYFSVVNTVTKACSVSTYYAPTAMLINSFLLTLSSWQLWESLFPCLFQLLEASFLWLLAPSFIFKASRWTCWTTPSRWELLEGLMYLGRARVTGPLNPVPK